MVSEVFFCAHFQEVVSRKTLYMRKDYRMKIINGVYTSAKIFTDTVEDYALMNLIYLMLGENFNYKDIVNLFNNNKCNWFFCYVD